MCMGAGETVDTAEEEAPEVDCDVEERTLLCYGQWAAHCAPDGRLVELVNCREQGQVCATHRCDSADDCTGCRQCMPGSTRCGGGGEREVCRDDGSGYELAEVCDEAAGEFCSLRAGVCEDLCAAAERDQSYIGCEYWAVATSNAELAFEGQDAEGLCLPFSFAVTIANPQGVSAEVVIESADQPDWHVQVAPDDAVTLELPCSPELKGDPEQEHLSVRAPRAAHRIRSNVPVTVYQWNPLEFESEDVRGDRIFSHTNDASLLLPVHSLTGEYVVMSQPTMMIELSTTDNSIEPMYDSGPGFVALIGVEPAPTEIEIVSSAYTQPSADGEIPALAPGDSLVVTLAQGEVLQLVTSSPTRCRGEHSDLKGGVRFEYCDISNEYDLTGTEIRSQGKVSVIAGHDCTFLPQHRWACDHLEETLWPVQAWGKEILIGMSETAACQDTLPNIVRVLSGADGNRVNFVPEVREPVVLDRGQFVEFEITQDLRVTASEAILVGQFLVGQNYRGIERGDAAFLKGDPSMSLGIPVEQWRTNYAFVAPETFTENYVNVVARERQLVLLDGRMVRGFVPIEGTAMASARVPVSAGQHRIESQQRFGIVVYGYALYTSYMMPGGLDLNRINGPD